MSKAPYVNFPSSLTGKQQSYTYLRTGNANHNVESGIIDRQRANGGVYTDSNTFRATLNGSTGADRVQINFVYSGDTSTTVPLGDGSYRYQIVAKLKYVNTCNIGVYVSWRTNGTVACSTKRNVGMTLNSQCGDGGYLNHTPTTYSGGPALTANDGIEHVFQVEWDSPSRTISAWCDGQPAATWVLNATSASYVDAMTGSAGIRSDNFQMCYWMAT